MAKVEVMENQLQIIVKESGLAPEKAKYILNNFQTYFEIAAEWETKAKAIKVTREDQKAEMDMAKVGRLFLKEKRIAIEKARKELKEQSLREGKAIDGIANVLKALIVPIEEYLEKQEKFIEFKKQAEEEARRLEIERRMEEERIAEEKRQAEEHERIRLENERLKKEVEEREKKMAEERKKQEAKLEKEKAKAEKERRELEKKANTERKAIEEKARKERELQEKKLAEERAKREAERKKAEEKARKEREEVERKAESERKEKERLEAMLKNQVTCPKCGHKFQLKEKK